jgi:hypothetical protein
VLQLIYINLTARNYVGKSRQDLEVIASCTYVQQADSRDPLVADLPLTGVSTELTKSEVARLLDRRDG